MGAPRPKRLPGKQEVRVLREERETPSVGYRAERWQVQPSSWGALVFHQDPPREG